MESDPDSYICPEIYSYISQTKPRLLTTQTKIDNLVLQTKIWIRDTTTSNVSLSGINQYIVDITQWIKSLRWSSKSLTKLAIELYLTPHRKVWCTETTNITRCHMNSGETEFYGKTECKIKIWRREDYHKVLIHELLHAFDWDRLLPVAVRHNATTKVHEAEAMIEALANVFQSLLFCQGSPQQFLKNRKQEVFHALRIVCALNSRPWTTTDTHVREYCILKAALLCSDRAFQQLNWWLSQSTESQCQKLWPSVKEFCETELRNVMASFKCPLSYSDCVSLQLVSQQLSLSPSRLVL